LYYATRLPRHFDSVKTGIVRLCAGLALVGRGLGAAPTGRGRVLDPARGGRSSFGEGWAGSLAAGGILAGIGGMRRLRYTCALPDGHNQEGSGGPPGHGRRGLAGLRPYWLRFCVLLVCKHPDPKVLDGGV